MHDLTKEELDKIHKLIMNALNMISKAEYILKKGSDSIGERKT